MFILFKESATVRAHTLYFKYTDFVIDITRINFLCFKHITYMETYYIYHIPGVKIGIGVNAKRRVKAQGYSDFEILEKHTDIIIASNRELELQELYGYEIDKTPYYITSQKNKELEQRIKTSSSMINNSNRVGKLHSNITKELMKDSALNRINPKRTNDAKVNLANGQSNSNIVATKQRKECDNCGKPITLINYNKHYNSCIKKGQIWNDLPFYVPKNKYKGSLHLVPYISTFI